MSLGGGGLGSPSPSLVTSLETFARILKSHGIATANRPHRTLRNFVVPKDKLKDQGAQERRDYHGLHGSAGTVLTAITLSYGEMAKFDSSQNQNPVTG